MKKILFFTLLFVLLIPCVCMAKGAVLNYSYVEEDVLHMGVTLGTPIDDSGLYIAVYTPSGDLTDMRKCAVDSEIYNVDVMVNDFSPENGEIVKLLYLGKNLNPLSDIVCHSENSIYLSGGGSSSGSSSSSGDETDNTPESRITYRTDGAFLTAFVEGTPMIGGYCAPDEVGVYLIGNYGYSDYWNDIIEANNFKIFLHNIPNINDYFGRTVRLYVEETGSDNRILSGISMHTSDKTICMEMGDIEEYDNDSIRYYHSKTATKTTTLKLNNPVVIINNEAGTIDDLKKVNDDAEITVIENTGDRKYDLIVVKDYSYDIVDSVEVGRGRFTAKYITGSFSFDYEDESVFISMTNKDGEPITLADFNEGDIIAYILDDGNKTAGYYNWIEIINLGKNYIRGNVTEINSSTNSVCIDGMEYGLTSDMPSPDVGDFGVFYLTKDNKIFMAEIDEFAGFEYAYILDIGMSEDVFSNTWMLKLLKADGSISIFDTTSYITVNGNIYSNESSSIGGLEYLEDLDFNENVSERLVAVKFSEYNDTIKEIKNPDRIQTIGSPEYPQDYDAENFRFGTKTLESDAIIFNIVNQNEDSSYTVKLEDLIDGNAYAGYIASKGNGNYDCMVITLGECNTEAEDPDDEIPDGGYGYILDMALSDNVFSSTWQFKLLTKDGDTVIYNAKDTFTVNGQFHYSDDDAIEGFEELVYSEFNEDVANRFISYKCNSQGEIIEISNAARIAVIGSEAEPAVYDGNKLIIDGKTIADNAIVFNIASPDPDNSFATDISSLVDGAKYAGYLVKNDTDEFDAFIVTYAGAEINYKQSISVADSVESIIFNNADAWRIHYYTANEPEIKELILTPDTKFEFSDDDIYTVARNLTKGTVFMFNADEYGIATHFVNVASPNSATDASSPAYTLNTEAVNKINSYADDEFVSGYITDIRSFGNTNIQYNGECDGNIVNGGFLVLTGSTNGYTYDNARPARVYVIPGDWCASDSIDIAEDGMATFFIAINRNGVVSDIVTYSTRKTI